MNNPWPEYAQSALEAQEMGRYLVEHPEAVPGSPNQPPLPPAPPKRRSDGMGPSWENSVERRLDGLDKKLDNRFMWLLAAFAAGFLAMGGLVLNRTDDLGKRIDAVGQHMSDLGERVAKVEARLPPPKP